MKNKRKLELLREARRREKLGATKKISPSFQKNKLGLLQRMLHRVSFHLSLTRLSLS